MMASFHPEGDGSAGQLAVSLAGTWKFESTHESGRVSECYLQLSGRGVFASPPEAETEIRGRWSVQGKEVELARFAPHGSSVTRWYTGSIDDANVVTGYIGDGGVEPVYAGTFTMRPVL